MRTIDLVAAYLDEHLHLAPDGPRLPATIEALAFRVGPFRFLCRADALTDTAAEVAVMTVQAAELVPVPYRSHLRAGQFLGRDVLRLKGGRLEIRGLQIESSLRLQPTTMVARGPRAAAPWISATTREPPAFVLDPDAAQLHFMRRSRPGA